MSAALQWMGSIAYTVILFLSVAVAASLICIVVPLFGRNAGWKIILLWHRFVMGALALLCGLNYTVEGREHIPERTGVAYLKHSSAMETIVELGIFPQQTWVLKRELMWAPFFGWAMATLSPIAIDRRAGGSAVEQVVSQGKDRLQRGLWVMIFPEGTRMPPGETRRYGVSGALLAAKTGCPLVPVAHNAGDFWPRRGWLKKRGTVRFVVGPPIATEGREPRQINHDAQQWIEATVARLRAESGHA